MSDLRSIFVRLCTQFRRTRRDRDFSAELDAHLQAHIDDNLRTGMTVEEARRHALIKFGGVDMTKEALREQRSIPIADKTWRELRHAGARLRRSPGFSSAAILSLALGANVSIAASSNASSSIRCRIRSPTA